MYFYFKFILESGLFQRNRRLRSLAKKLMKDDSGMGTLEIIIIIAVLVALALVFRNFIMDMAGMIFDKIKAKTDATINTL